MTHKMIRALGAILLIALVQWAAPAWAQSWTTGARPVVFQTPWTIGDGVDRVPEVSTTTQGGDPPALAYEPAVINEAGHYVRSQWLSGANVSRSDQGEAKFRLTCAWSVFAARDPIVFPGQTTAGHHHTFVGNKTASPSSNYTSQRNSPASSCAGGPLIATLYWKPSLMFEIRPNVFVPVKQNVTTFYYTEEYARSPELYRLPNGFQYIGGANPMDRLNTARLAEIPDGQGWDKTRRYNGWNGWYCYNTGNGLVINPTPSTTSDIDAQYSRQLVNPDGSDPWAGACEGTDKRLVVDMQAPDCWDGYNLTSPDGRSHVRYSIRKTDSSATRVCPNGWWRIPKLEDKTEYSNGTATLNGHAYRSKLHLSSDRMNPNPANWQPRGSTMHFDWIGAVDRVVFNSFLKWCVGVTINGDPGQPLTCGNNTISPTENMISGASPDPSLSNDPVVTVQDYSTGPSKARYGPISPGTAVDAIAAHNHQ